MMNSLKNRKSLLLKSAIAVTMFLLLLWLLVPGEHYQRTNKEMAQVQDDASDHCTSPYPGRPLVQYAVMIDAGSSGSRVHVYRFNFCKEEPELEDEVFHPIEPGLSSYENDPQAAAESLDELMKIAMDNVPAELQRCTPISLKATAGLRLLGKEKSDKILKAVHTRLSTQYPFSMPEENSVSIMDGKDEGVYAWITVNYLLGKLKKSQKGRSAAVFDLGGASTQIVFEPQFNKDEAMLKGDHKYELNYGDELYDLYQHSYLGFGLKEARKQIKAAAIQTWQDETGVLPSQRIHHPCLPLNHTETVAFSHGNTTRSVELVGNGAGHAECRAVVERIFGKSKACELAPCAFDGVYQPPLMETFNSRDLYVFSFFYDLTQPLGMPEEFSVAELGELAQRVCSGQTLQFEHVPSALATLASSPDYCLDLTYTYGLLRIGYDIRPERLVRTAKKIRGAETGWCLGASIALIDQAKVCQVA